MFFFQLKIIKSRVGESSFYFCGKALRMFSSILDFAPLHYKEEMGPACLRKCKTSRVLYLSESGLHNCLHCVFGTGSLSVELTLASMLEILMIKKSVWEIEAHS